MAPFGAEADMPEARSLGKRAVSPVSSVVTAELVAAEATPPAPQRTEGASGSAEDRLTPMDVDVAPLPPPLPSRMSVEVEDLHLRCADAKVEAATAQTQLTPLAAQIKELEEELTHAVSDRDAFRSRAKEATASGKALARQLGAEESAHRLTKGALNEALASVEASQIEAVVLRGTVEELGSEASRAAEASRVKAQRLKEQVEAC
ncbi:coiled-coil domain-containing protein SCD2-like [Miscanthus floridulus]|uniref:coiled-coil domain-containing protein SCD2-like n=1 Tax=Miscanthus floridulus TaxID=154761 RepID=UPI0034581537